MGLDMYLNRITSVQSYWLEGTKLQEAGLKPKVILEDFPHIDPEQLTRIVESVGVWRKCNAIHNWFVENVQNGEDDCGEYELSVVQLEELFKICEDIWRFYETNSNNHGQPNEKAKQFAEENLPNTEGFFFGSQEYNKDYFEWQIKPTIDMLKPIIENKPDLFFHWYTYQSSW